MEFIKSNLWEIRNSTSLKFLGFVISLSHAALLYSWWGNAPLLLGHTPLCWSFLPNCQDLVFSTQGNIQILKYLYVLLTAISLLAFSTNRALGFGLLTLSSASIVNLIFLFYDSSFNTNLNSFVLTMTFFFICIPQKVRVAKVVIISSYFIWGLLKVNNEWLAGYWLSKNLEFYLPPKGIEWVAAISLFAELVVPLFLLSKQTQRFYTGITLILIYSIFTGYIQGIETFLIHLLVILFFVVNFFEEEKEARESIYRSFIRPEPTKLWVAFSIVFIWAFQMFPQGFFAAIPKIDWPLAYQKNPIPVECKYHSFVVFENELHHHSSKLIEAPVERMHCNSQMYLKNSQKLCEEFGSQPKFAGVSAYFLKRVISQKDFTRVFEAENVCNLDPKKIIGAL